MESGLWCAPSCSTGGAYRDRHGRWRQDAMDVSASRRRRRGRMERKRTAKARGPGPPTLGSSLTAIIRQATEAIKPGTPGRARYTPLTPLRREGRTVSATCGDDSCAFYLCTRGCGCAKHPAFPAPSVLRGACKTDNSGKSCRENVDARHCERKRFDTRHGRARPGHPRLTALASRTGRPNSNCRQQSIESSRREANA
jgi:hypothetical protein